MKVWRLDHPASRWSALKSSLTNYRSSPVMDKYFYSLHQKHDDKKMHELLKTLYWNTIRPGVIHMLFISLGRIWFFRYSPSSGDSRYNFAETIFLKNEINLQDSALKFTPKHKYWQLNEPACPQYQALRRRQRSCRRLPAGSKCWGASRRAACPWQTLSIYAFILLFNVIWISIWHTLKEVYI